MVLEESGVIFSFHKGWHVIQWDKHTYFKGLSAVGLKGVDFLGFHPKHGLFLMEIKNYRDQPPPPYPDLASNLIQKGMNTVDGIDAVHSFLHRSAWRHRFKPFWLSIPPSWSDRAFWYQLTAIKSRKPLCQYLIWIAGEKIEPNWNIELKLELRSMDLPFEVATGGPTSCPFPNIVRWFPKIKD